MHGPFGLLVWLSVFYPHIEASGITGSNTEDEERFETEIDIREPRSFTDRTYSMLLIRHDGFKEMTCSNNGDLSSRYIPNWEVFASQYWYETRTPNCSCPITPKGIAAASDWAMLVPCMFGNVTKPPKLVYVSTMMLPHFSESTLRFMPLDWRFILISAGHDRTIPNSSGDRRFQALRGMWNGAINWARIIEAPQVVHWWAENKDVVHPKLSALPTGMCADNPDNFTEFPDQASIKPIMQRPLKVMSLDRQRTGPQFADRAVVEVMCLNSTLCYQPPPNPLGEIGRKEYLAYVASVPFIACVHGGGLDPSPKAWEALLVGTIPIIQHSTVEDAYHHFPVAFIDNWSDLFGDEERGRLLLEQWLKELAPFYEHGSHLRMRTLDRLKQSYWLELFHHKLRSHEEEEARVRANETAIAAATAATAPAVNTATVRVLHSSATS